MIANTRKMREVQNQLKRMLESELYLCDFFNQSVADGVMTEEKLQELAKLVKNPKLHQDEIVRVKKEDIMSNPYLQNIDIPLIQMGKFKLSKKRIIRPGQISRFGEERRDEKSLREVNSYFVCDQNLRFPALIEGEGRVPWMTVEPTEAKSFEGIIDQAKGNVLLIGCGLGYLSYMLSRKEDVTSITVVEISKDVLDLFETHILPQFENKDKVTTVNADGLEYLRTTDLSAYDHVNVDVWYDTIDMIYPYLRCLEIEKTNPNIEFSYWLEGALKAAVQKGILIAATKENLVSGKEDAKLSYPSSANIYAVNTIFSIIGEDAVRNNQLNTAEDIHDLVFMPNMRDFLFEWYANNLEIVDFQEKLDMGLVKALDVRRTHFDKLKQEKIYTFPPIK